jgi:hypothetical protein
VTLEFGDGRPEESTYAGCDMKVMDDQEFAAWLDKLAAEIRSRIVAGSSLLETEPLGTGVRHLLKTSQAYGDELHAMSASELMTDLVKGFILIWPHESPVFRSLGQLLSPLNEIAALLNPDEINESVYLWPTPCVMKDRRTVTRDTFKEALRKRLFG